HMTYLQIAVEAGIPGLILFLMFFARGFMNLWRLQKRKDLTPELQLFVGALHSVLVGFIIGALFSPEAYQFFPFFAVVYTSALLAYVREDDRAKAAADGSLTPKFAGPVSARYANIAGVPVNT